ncbi:hypothetical protein ACI79G_01115 [Geodermatophilus sp. SYSU D00779]
MRDTGQDVEVEYEETSRGGLAVDVIDVRNPPPTGDGTPVLP